LIKRGSVFEDQSIRSKKRSSITLPACLTSLNNLIPSSMSNLTDGFNGARDTMDYYRREIDKRKACTENEGKDYLVDGYEEEDDDFITSTMNYYKEHDVYTATDAMVALRLKPLINSRLIE